MLALIQHILIIQSSLYVTCLSIIEDENLTLSSRLPLANTADLLGQPSSKGLLPQGSTSSAILTSFMTSAQPEVRITSENDHNNTPSFSPLPTEFERSAYDGWSTALSLKFVEQTSEAPKFAIITL